MQKHFSLAVSVLTTLLLSYSFSFAADPQDHPVRIVLIGDSTVASYAHPPADRPDLTGWGQVFGEFFNDHVTIVNRAASGRSSKSFLSEGRWKTVLKDKPDYVFIQFGHNDSPGKGERTTDPKGDFRDNLRKYIKESRDANATPILVTPVSRRTFVDGKLVDKLQPYADAMFTVGKEENVPVIDLHGASGDLFRNLGDAGSADLNPKPGDKSHFSRKGALAMAKLVVDRLPRAIPALTKYLKSPPPPSAQ